MPRNGAGGGAMREETILATVGGSTSTEEFAAKKNYKEKTNMDRMNPVEVSVVAFSTWEDSDEELNKKQKHGTHVKKLIKVTQFPSSSESSDYEETFSDNNNAGGGALDVIDATITPSYSYLRFEFTNEELVQKKNDFHGEKQRKPKRAYASDSFSAEEEEEWSVEEMDAVVDTVSPSNSMNSEVDN